jgi:lipopolysaccharide/colanic/teichoic acid biosynthesis glycosyltransferase
MINNIIKRFVDLLFSLIGLIVLSPIFVCIAICIKLESKGPIVFKQMRVGKNNIDFRLLKFRSMFVDTEHKGQLTIGNRDPRITKVGYFIRQFKFDELPQLWNVFIGEMSFVGPRPEVRKYVSHYTVDQLRVLSIKPGITDYASIKYFNENEILAQNSDPEQSYLKEIMPEKLRINLDYVEQNSIFTDFKIIFTTFKRFFIHR